MSDVFDKEMVEKTVSIRDHMIERTIFSDKSYNSSIFYFVMGFNQAVEVMLGNDPYCNRLEPEKAAEVIVDSAELSCLIVDMISDDDD